MRNAEPFPAFFPRRLRAALAVCALISMFAGPVAAKDSGKAAEPDPAVNPALADLIKSGAKFFYLGRYAGLDGWVAVKDGQIQIIYKPTGNAYALVGYLFGPQGENITADQVHKLTATNPELAALAMTTNDLPAVSGADPADQAADQKVLEALRKIPPDELLLPDGERFLKHVKKAASVELGGKDASPQLYVLLAPDCSSCKAFWRKFRDPAQKGEVQLRIIPGGARDSEQERAAARLLHAADPMAAWDKYMDGDKSLLAGTPDQAQLDQVRANEQLIKDWNIATLPYFAYRAKDGQVKVVQGVPDQPQTILNDIYVETPEAKP